MRISGIAAAAVLAGCHLPDRGSRVHLPDAPHPVTTGTVTLSAETAAAIDARILSHLEAYEVPALSLALVADGEVAYTAAYGWSHLETAEAATPQTPFLLASVSKTLIGITAMQARDQGLLSLDDPIEDITGLVVDNPRVDGETITLRHLLTHHSGVEDSSVYDASYAPGDPTIALGDFLAGYLAEDGEYYRRANYSKEAPGAAFSYSNIGASLAAYAVEAATGESYADVVDHEILAPLGMVDSGFFLSSLPTAPATGYGTTLLGGGWKPYEDYGFPSYPDGLMRSSADDLGRLLAGMQADGALLSAASIDELLTVDESLGTDEDGQAIAWVRREMGGRTLMGHNGGDFGTSAELWLDREAGLGIAVVMNADFINTDAWLALFAMESDVLDLLDEGR